jgi:hypothetical protein
VRSHSEASCSELALEHGPSVHALVLLMRSGTELAAQLEVARKKHCLARTLILLPPMSKPEAVRHWSEFLAACTTRSSGNCSAAQRPEEPWL